MCVCVGVKQAMFSSMLRHVTLYLSGWEGKSSPSLWRPDPTAGCCHLWVRPISGITGPQITDPRRPHWRLLEQPATSFCSSLKVWTFARTTGKPDIALVRLRARAYYDVKWQGISLFNSRMKSECMAVRRRQGFQPSSRTNEVGSSLKGADCSLAPGGSSVSIWSITAAGVLPWLPRRRWNGWTAFTISSRKSIHRVNIQHLQTC